MDVGGPKAEESVPLGGNLVLEPYSVVRVDIVREDGLPHTLNEWELRQSITAFLQRHCHQRIQESDILVKWRTELDRQSKGDPVGSVLILCWGNDIPAARRMVDVLGQKKELRVSGIRLYATASLDGECSFQEMEKQWKDASDTGGRRRSDAELPDTVRLRGVPSRWLAEQSISSKHPSLLVSHSLFSPLGAIRNIEIEASLHSSPAQAPSPGLTQAGGTSVHSSSATSAAASGKWKKASGGALAGRLKLNSDVVIQFQDHQTFCSALTALCNRALVQYGEGASAGKVPSAKEGRAGVRVRYSVEWLHGDYFEERNVRRRRFERQQQEQEEKLRKEREEEGRRRRRQEQEDQERQRAEDQQRQKQEEEARQRRMEEERLEREAEEAKALAAEEAARIAAQEEEERLEEERLQRMQDEQEERERAEMHAAAEKRQQEEEVLLRLQARIKETQAEAEGRGRGGGVTRGWAGSPGKGARELRRDRSRSRERRSPVRFEDEMEQKRQARLREMDMDLDMSGSMVGRNSNGEHDDRTMQVLNSRRPRRGNMQYSQDIKEEEEWEGVGRDWTGQHQGQEDRGPEGEYSRRPVGAVGSTDIGGQEGRKGRGQDSWYNENVVALKRPKRIRSVVVLVVDSPEHDEGHLDLRKQEQATSDDGFTEVRGPHSVTSARADEFKLRAELLKQLRQKETEA